MKGGGQYFGYYDSKSNWVTGQNGKNDITHNEAVMVNNSLANMELFSKRWFISGINNLLIALAIKRLP